ncbi:MAG: OpgC domain-containing protein [Pseudomonadota bacterium]
MSTLMDAKKAAAVKAPRDPRLDFFRGIAMFIILLAHTPGNTWTLWIPARFGFSDATEIFVFCSGMASALAFGAVFSNKSWWLGSARIAFRVWQVYWAHIGVFLVSALLMIAIDHYGLGPEGKEYAKWPSIIRLFTDTQDALLGLFTLTYIPGLFDILPMYLVILAMVPAVMGLHALGGRWAVFAAMGVTWAAAQLAGYARGADDIVDPTMLQAALIALGEPLQWMNFRGSPFNDSHTWFFNPFGWQLIFFTGFSFGMGWIPAPPVKLWLIALCAAILFLILPVAWVKLYAWMTGYLPETWGGAFLWDAREALRPIWWKSWQGLGRYVHFLALAYVAWVAVGPRGVRLSEGFEPAAPAGIWALRAAAAVALVTIPYAYIDEIKWLSPAIDNAILSVYPALYNQLGLAQIAHLIALIVLVWAAIGEEGRRWIARDMVVRSVPVIQKVGTQSLAVFLVSIVLSRFNGFLLDVIGRDVWTRAGVNLWGFAVLIATAYIVSWFKRQPWRTRPATAGAARETARDGEGAADPRGRPPIAAMRP